MIIKLNAMNRRSYPPRGFRIFVFLILAGLVLSGIVMWLWNQVLVPVTDLKSINYWQALGILILSRILFGGFKFGNRSKFSSGGPYWGEKWKHMSEEDRQKFKEKWKERCKSRKE